MKKIVLLILLFSSLTVFSQKNAVKFGLLGIEYGDFSIGYERLIKDNNSININLGYWDLNTSAIDLLQYSEEGKGVWLSSLGHGIHSSIDFRFYMNEESAIKGFYFSPYLRYWDHSFTFNDVISNNKITNIKFNVPTKLNSFGVGFQIGYHWQIYDHVSIDWYFFGAGIEKLKLDAIYKAADVENFNYKNIEADVKEVFSNVKFIEKNVTTEVTSDGLKIILPQWLPGIRSGFTIGYAF